MADYNFHLFISTSCSGQEGETYILFLLPASTTYNMTAITPLRAVFQNYQGAGLGFGTHADTCSLALRGFEHQ